LHFISRYTIGIFENRGWKKLHFEKSSTEAKLKFFIDTNIIISSALFPDGKTAFVFSYILEIHEIIISTIAIEECFTVFKRKFPDKLEHLAAFLEGINYSKYKSPENIDPKIYPEIRDKNDLPILVSAILSDSDIFLTGDKDFADIKIDKPLIYTPAEYYELITKKDT
jgi:putative PIN family toxin of toxin-antitoxin system